MVYIGVGLGGMLGSILRYLVSLGTSNFLDNDFPIGTLMANLAGSLFLGWFMSRMIARNRMSTILATSIGTGITGSFTTFSAFSLETLFLLESGRMGMAIAYVTISAVGGFLLAALGYKVGAVESGRKAAT